MILSVALGCVCLCAIWMLLRIEKKAKEAFRALCEDCDAAARLLNWWMANPGVPIGLSHEGKRLVLESIRAYDRFTETHPYLVKDTEFRRTLVELLTDFGPPPPPPPAKSKRPFKPKQLAHASCSFEY